nr:MAG TPA: hypothetical protein [Caudoviricetes sp.]
MSKKAVNKVVVDGVTKLDLTRDSVTPQTLLAGATAHNAAGEQIEGAVTVAPASDTVPLAPDDTGNAGTEGKYARGDHVHPRDATKQGKITVDGILQGDGEGNISAAEVQETEELDIPTGILKGTANGIEAAAAGADYMAPASNEASAAAGQVLTKTANGQEWADAAGGDVFWATYGEAKATAFPKIQSAVEQNKIVLLKRDSKIYILSYLANSIAAFISTVPSTAKQTGDGESSGYGIFLTNSGWSTDDVWQQFDPCAHNSTHAKGGTDPIAPADIGAIASDSLPSTASVLKSDGAGGLAAAEAGTDYMAPVAVTAADNGKFLRVVNGAWAAAAVANASGVSF